MKKTTTQHGFTLVELAIVMTIIGLLIGGILKGQELMLNARVTATIAQVRSYEAAATTFRDSFASLPGDMNLASTRLPGCTVACDPVAATAGNSIIGSPTWTNTSTWTSQGVPLSDATVAKETTLFWIHLLTADLISGVSPLPISTPATTVQWGVTHPQARINGGFVVGYANGVGAQPGLSTSTTAPTGMVLTLVNAPNSDPDTVAGQNPLSAGKSAQLDRKMDDGRPSSGFVQAYGVTASCFTSTSALNYAEATPGNDCGLIFRIQG